VLATALFDTEQRVYVEIFKEVGGDDDPCRTLAYFECHTAELQAIRDD